MSQRNKTTNNNLKQVLVAATTLATLCATTSLISLVVHGSALSQNVERLNSFEVVPTNNRDLIKYVELKGDGEDERRVFKALMEQDEELGHNNPRYGRSISMSPMSSSDESKRQERKKIALLRLADELNERQTLARLLSSSSQRATF